MDRKGVATALLLLVACSAHAASDSANAAPVATNGIITSGGHQHIADIVPGQSTKTDVESLLGPPWRVVQFNDCGMAMDDQADETWEYRGTDQDGDYRLHVEFGDDGVVHLTAKIPDNVRGGKATDAKVAPPQAMKGMSM
jgi:hypothetical protein